MTTWFWILSACALAYLLKLIGYLVPHRYLDNPRFVRIAGVMTIGLLASLVTINTVATGQQLTLDARIFAFAAAAVALMLRAPFLFVVLLGVLAAAGARLLGFP